MPTVEEKQLQKALDIAHEALLQACGLDEVVAAEWLKKASAVLLSCSKMGTSGAGNTP